jgi:lysozyme
VILSPRGLAAIKEHEALRLTMYDDSGGACTIGYGHLVHKGRTGTNPKAEAPFKGGISENIASDLLMADTGIAQRAVARFVSVPLAPYQFDALVSLVFNIGGEAFRKSTLVKRLNAANFEGAARQFDVWVIDNGKRVQGLVNRRAKERAMFEGR